MKQLFYILIGASLLTLSCKDEEFSDIPEIEVISISPSTVVEFQDSIVVELSYVDGNGDLGENDPNVKNLFLIDSRNGVEYSYRIQQLNPDEDERSLQGTLKVEIASTAITDGSNSQSVHYTVFVVDRAGNESNHAVTPSIQITPN